MKLSADGLKLIQSFEGLSLTAYRDASGWSIGYGHFGAKPGQTITRAEADRLFAADCIKYEAAVSLVTPAAKQHEFDAMVSLCYNVGTGDTKNRDGGFAGSTVARLHNMGDRQGAADAFRMWNKSEGKVNPTLVQRREKERAVYLNGYAPFTGGLPEPAKPAPVASSGSSGSKALASGAGLALLVMGLGLVLVLRGR